MIAGLQFGVSVAGASDRDAWQGLARSVESAGFDALFVPDHLAVGMPSPMVALLSAADATERITVGTLVLNNDFRHPVTLAREAASMAVLTGERFELGLGAGYNRCEYDEAGVAFDPPAVRVNRLGDSVRLIKELWQGEPVWATHGNCTVNGHTAWPVATSPIPLLIGGNGRALLRLAAECADIVGLIGIGQRRDGAGLDTTQLTYDRLAEQARWIQDNASRRAKPPVLSVLVQDVVITDDRGAGARAIQEWMPEESVASILNSPYLLVGTRSEIACQLLDLRDNYGATCVTVLGSSFRNMASILEELR